MEDLKKEESVPNYEILRQKIAGLKSLEMAKKEKNPLAYNSHFDHIDPAVLTEKDLDKYQKYLDGTLTEEEFLEYKRTFQEVKGIDDPRLNFMAWLGNKLNTIEWTKKWHPEIHKKYFEDK